MESIDCARCFAFYDEIIKLEKELKFATKQLSDFRVQSRERESICEREHEEVLRDLERSESEKLVLVRKFEATKR